MTDRELVEEVLQSSNNAVVTVILGTKDKVVCSQAVQTFLAPYKDRVRIVKMEGLGHDPFEEDVAGFVELVEQLLHEDKEKILGL
jgi:pimeloyl-ACP methyl ester carboxylesterase